MALDRRIVLEDSEICSPPAPEAQEPIPTEQISRPSLINPSRPWKWPETWQPILQTDGWPETRIIQPNGALDNKALGQAIKKDQRLTQFRDFNDYFNLGQIGLQPELACKGCGSTSGFEPDFDMETFCCKTCGRQTTFQMFKQEHP